MIVTSHFKKSCPLQLVELWFHLRVNIHQSWTVSFSRWWVLPSLCKGHGQYCSLTQLTWPHAARWTCRRAAVLLQSAPNLPEGQNRRGGIWLPNGQDSLAAAGVWKGRGKMQQKERIKRLPVQSTIRKNAPVFLRVSLFFFSLFGLAHGCLQLPLLVA